MRSTLVCAAIFVMLSVSASAFGQQPDQPQQPPANQDKIKDPATSSARPTPPAPPVSPAQIGSSSSGDSLAAAARRAREAKKDQAQSAAHVFDNDSIPKQGGVSSVGADDGSSSAAADTSASGVGAAPAAGATPGANDEKGWRETFAKLRHKLDQDQAALDIMQRELGVLDVQYYNDPNKALQQTDHATESCRVHCLARVSPLLSFVVRP